jgi:hypothetical protein
MAKQLTGCGAKPRISMSRTPGYRKESVMTNIMKNTARISTLIALSTLGACTSQSDELGYKMGDLEADLEDGIDHLARTVSANRIRDLSRSDRSEARPDETDVSDETIRDELVAQVRTLAESDECTVKGAIMGDYVDGFFHGTAVQDGEILTAIFRGDYAVAADLAGGTFDGGYLDHERSNGTMDGTFLAPGLHDSGPLGTFQGSWVESDRGSDRLAEGNLGGVWLGQDRTDGGIFIGYWSNCSDVERPVDPREEERDEERDESREDSRDDSTGADGEERN